MKGSNLRYCPGLSFTHPFTEALSHRPLSDHPVRMQIQLQVPVWNHAANPILAKGGTDHPSPSDWWLLPPLPARPPAFAAGLPSLWVRDTVILEAEKNLAGGRVLVTLLPAFFSSFPLHLTWTRWGSQLLLDELFQPLGHQGIEIWGSRAWNEKSQWWVFRNFGPNIGNLCILSSQSSCQVAMISTSEWTED